MGIYFTDKFSLLHFASGIVSYYWGLSLLNWFMLHLIYEILQNSYYGIWFVNNIITLWPGGKLNYDSCINIIGDQFYGILGWVFTHYFIHFLYKGSMNDTK